MFARVILEDGVQETAIQLENMTGTALSAAGLCKTFTKRDGLFGRKSKQLVALDDVSFHVYTGEIYGLLGPNGSGKSTLIRILSTLLTTDKGEVSVMGRKLPADEKWVRENIGRVSVDAAFYKKLSARENLLYAGQLYGLTAKEVEKRALDVLQEIGLDSNRFHDSLEDMSRGMQQKIAVTRALIIDPPLLLLDEPTTGLDPRSRRDVQGYLERLRKEKGTTILLTTHDMAEAERLCDRIGFIANGRIVAEGTANELKTKSQKETLEEAFIDLTGEDIHEDEVKE